MSSADPILLRQACLNAAAIEQRGLNTRYARYYLKGRFGEAPYGGSQEGLGSIVDIIRRQYRILTSRQTGAA